MTTIVVTCKISTSKIIRGYLIPVPRGPTISIPSQLVSLDHVFNETFILPQPSTSEEDSEVNVFYDPGTSKPTFSFNLK